MTRSSPGVHRVAAILNFIADHPGQAFTLTDLVRALKLSRATCHALLSGLVEVGYLYRASDKSYVLGPALARIGKRVADHFSPWQVAQPEMRTLADEFDVVCSAYVLEGESAVVRERAASALHVGSAAPLGARVKLRPESAATFFAWSPPKEAHAWLDSLEPAPSAEQRDILFERMAFAREHGFILIVRTAPASAQDSSSDRVLGAETIDLHAYLGEVREDQSYMVASILAPVFDAQGKVSFALGLAGFQQSMDGREVLRIAHRLKAACDRITNFIVGPKSPVTPDESLAA